MVTGLMHADREVELPDPHVWDEEMLKLSPKEAATIMLDRVRSLLRTAAHPRTNHLTEEEISYLPERVRDKINRARAKRALRQDRNFKLFLTSGST